MLHFTLLVFWSLRSLPAVLGFGGIAGSGRGIANSLSWSSLVLAFDLISYGSSQPAEPKSIQGSCFANPGHCGVAGRAPSPGRPFGSNAAYLATDRKSHN